MQKNEFLHAVLTHGESAQSFLGTYPTYQHQNIEGAAIAYVTHHRTWILAGPPIAPPTIAEKSYHALASYADQTSIRVLAVALNSKEAQNAKQAGFGALWIGRDPWIDLDTFDPSLAKFPQARRLAKSGARVEKLNPLALTSAERRGVLRLHNEWLESRKMPPLGFLSQLNLWEGAEYRRYFQLSVPAGTERKNVAALIAVPAPAAKTWYLNDLLRGKDAPNGSSELLLHQAMIQLKAEGAVAVNLGVAPFSRAPADASGHRRLFGLFGLVYQWGNLFYGFRNLATFKKKMNPSRWEPSYLCYYPAKLLPSDAQALATAFLPRGIFSALITGLWRSFQLYPIGAKLCRRLRADVFTNESPETMGELWKSSRATHVVITGLIALHGLRYILFGTAGAGTLIQDWGFDYHAPFKASGMPLLLAPFLHWDGLHLLFNVTLIGIFGAVVETLLGRACFVATFFFSAVVGQALSAALAATLATATLQKLLISSHAIDIGASLGACGLAGALCGCMRQGWVLAGLIVAGSVLMCVSEQSVIALNHVVAAAVGFFLAWAWLSQPRTRL